MRISQVLIVPGVGHTGPGQYDRGHAIDSFAEIDVVDKYVASMVDELENCAIRHSVLKTTRRAPGVSPPERALGIYPGTLVVHCRVGWNDSKKVKAVNNLSAVMFGQKDSEGLARELAAIVGHWGALYVFGHRSASPAPDEDKDLLLQVPSTLAVRLEPFQMNAPNVHEYARRLHQLGRDVGRGLADWLEERGDSARYRPNLGVTKGSGRVLG